MTRYLCFCFLATLCLPLNPAGAAELYDWNGQQIDITVPPAWPAPPGLRRQPVLFVHGHAPDTAADPNYKRNFWEEPAAGLTSFRRTLDDNSGLDVEPYYIRFADRTRSITDDAFDIGEVVDYIVRRHNESFDPATAASVPPVQIAIVAYSKGTISTRQYLKSLLEQVQDNGGISMPPPRPGYRPVSEFIAIAPPNHGISSPAFVLATDQIAVQQLYNGVRPEGTALCGTQFLNPLPQAANFIERLNGETTLDSVVANAAPAPAEAPGSRASSQGPHTGTLYVTLYADPTNPDELVGGDSPSGDCAGRVFARNLAPQAINIPIEVAGAASEVHENTVHAPDIICKALYAAVHHRSPETQACTGAVPIVPLPQPAAAMLALDISGSMLARQCTNCPTRYDILRQAVEIFAQLWSQMGRANDRLGVTYFRTTIDEPLINGERLPMLSGNVATLIGDVNSQGVVPANLTAMGGGVQRALDALQALDPDLAETRHVILFSDGMQNVNPMVVPPQHVEIDNLAGRPDSGVPAATPPTRLDAQSPLRIDTIAVGAGAFVDVLSDIAAHGQGFSRQTLDANDLRQFFVEQLIDTLRTGSPQLVGYRRSALKGRYATQSFKVNRGVRKLLFKVSWGRGQRLDVRVFKDGLDMTGSAQVAAGEFYRILAISSSKNGRDPASGEWRLRISGKPGTAYEAAAIVDEKELHHQARLERLPDATLGLSVQVGRGRRTIDGPVAVTATIIRPRVAIGNVLAGTKPAKPGSGGTEPGMTDAERRVAALLQDPDARDRLRPVTKTIRLRPDSRGGFRAVVADAGIPGIYRAEVRVVGSDRALGPLERSQAVSATVPFGEADRGRSAVTLRRSPNSRAVELTVRPADRHGSLLGPTFADRIVLDLSSGRIDRGPEDLGDGRYRFVFSPLDGTDPALTLTVGGQPLFHGTVKELDRLPRR